jgi:glycine cleavage system T protein (aminomethyltransferase)
MSSASGSGKKTALYDKHVALGARMVPFAGYLMPLSYSGQIAEHNAVRNGVGLFDLSHMGEFLITGPGAVEAVDRLLTNRLVGTHEGQAVYAPMCLDSGGIVDDLIAYNLPDGVYLVVNASNIDKDARWVQEHLPAGVNFGNISDHTSLIAIQGPKTLEFLTPLTDRPVAHLGTYTSTRAKVMDVEALVSRTGYTGEDGYELYVPNSRAAELWDGLMEQGKRLNLTPIGLAARDTLRFEMGYCLYGNDIDETTTPLEAGLSWTVKLDKGDFIGRDALVAQKQKGIPRRLVGLRPQDERAIPRHGYVLKSEGCEVGHVTSGTFAPSLGLGLGMGYVESSLAGPGSGVTIDMRGRAVSASVTALPFYAYGSRPSPGRKKF